MPIPAPEGRPRNRDGSLPPPGRCRSVVPRDPTRVIPHRLSLAGGPHGYDIFKNEADGCEKVVLKP